MLRKRGESRSHTQVRAREREITPGKRTLTEELPRKGASGAPLPQSLAHDYSQGLGADLAGVRVHTDDDAADAAEALSARAFTQGQDIFFARGAWDPGSKEGAHLLAHEVAHTVQQSGSAPATQTKLEVSMPGDALEVEADRAADALVAGAPVPSLTRATGGGIARAPEPEPYFAASGLGNDEDGLTAREWFENYEPQFMSELDDTLHRAELRIPTQFVNWQRDASYFLVVFFASIWQQADEWSALSACLAPDRLDLAINAGRDCNRDRGRDEFAPAAVGEVRRLLVKRLVESLERIVPRYLAARNHIALLAESIEGIADVDPGLDDVLPSHPIDPYVIRALDRELEFELVAYRAANSHEELLYDSPRPRPVTFEWQHEQGAPNWIRVIEPRDATAEQVALTLCGTATSAYLLVDAAPLFGFPDCSILAPAQYAEWERRRARRVPVSFDSPLHEGALADEVMINQARGIAPRDVPPSDGGKMAVIENMRLAARECDAIVQAVSGWPIALHVPDMVRPIREEIDARSWRLSRPEVTPEEVVRWDTQARGQWHLLIQAGMGLAEARKHYETFKRWPNSEQVVRHITDLYLEVVFHSDFYQVGSEKLEHANQQSEQFPVIVIELLLAEIRYILDAARENKRDDRRLNDERYGIASLQSREARLRERLIVVRDILLQDPGAAQQELSAIQEELADLQTESSIVCNMDQMDAAWRALHDSLTGIGGFSGTNDEAREAQADVERIHRDWNDNIYLKWTRGEKEEAQRELESKRPEWEQRFQRIGSQIEDNAMRDRWLEFGALVAISIVTMGVGAYIGTYAAAAWGATTLGAGAAFAVTVGAEAAIFTTLSTLVLRQDPTIAGGMGDLAKNVAVFGLLRGAGGLLTRAMGQELAASTVGHAGHLAAQFVSLNAIALAETLYHKAATTGEGLTWDEVTEISRQTFLFLAVTAVAARALGPGLERLRLRGAAKGHLARVRALKAEVRALATEIRAQQVRDPARVKDLVNKECELLEMQAQVLLQLQRMAADPKQARQAGLDSPEAQAMLLELRADHVEMQQAAKMLDLVANVESAGTREFLCRTERWDQDVALIREKGWRVVDLVRDDVTGARAIEITPTEPGAAPFILRERRSNVDGVVGAPVRPARGLTESQVLQNIARASQASFWFHERARVVGEQVDAMEIAEFERLQLGNQTTAIINQATLPRSMGGGRTGGVAAPWPPRILTVAEGGRTWADRAPTNQTAGELNAPELAVSDLVTDQNAYVPGPDLADAVAWGQERVGMSLYEARIVGSIEAREPGQGAWPSSRRYRILVERHGRQRYLYADAIDICVGGGPSQHLADSVVPHGRAEMEGDGRLVQGDRPPTPPPPGARRALVVGGSGNGAAMADHYASCGLRVTWLGRENPENMPPELSRELAEIDALPEEQRALLASRRNDILAFRRAMLPRDLERSFDSDVAHELITRQVGELTKIEPTTGADGRPQVSAMITTNSEPEIFDLVVVSMGQNPRAPGGAAWLVGQAPLRMERSADGHVTGLVVRGREEIRLLGPAAMDLKLAPFVEDSQVFVEQITSQAAQLPPNSRGVLASIAMARETIRAGNERLAVESFRLPADATLELPSTDRPSWPRRIAEFFAGQLCVDVARISIIPLGGGRSEASVYRIRLGVEEVGVFKVFPRGADARAEVDALALLADQHQRSESMMRILDPVGERGLIRIGGIAGNEPMALLMEAAHGRSVDQLIRDLPIEPEARTEAFATLGVAVQRVARGLAEMHRGLASGRSMAEADKFQELTSGEKGGYAGRVLDKLELARLSLGEQEYRSILALLVGRLIPEFVRARVPATLYHGDANAGNFILDADLNVRLIDVGNLGRSQVEAGQPRAGQPKETGANDVARFLESLESLRPGALTPPEIQELTHTFNESYFAHATYGVTEADFRAATQLCRLELEFIIVGKDPAHRVDALGRIHRILGMAEAQGLPPVVPPAPVEPDDDRSSDVAPAPDRASRPQPLR